MWFKESLKQAGNENDKDDQFRDTVLQLSKLSMRAFRFSLKAGENETVINTLRDVEIHFQIAMQSS